MDESLHELETELKALRPRQPAPALLERIGSELAPAAGESAADGNPRYTSATNLNSWKWLGWQTAGIAAAVALVALASWLNFKARTTPAPATPPVQLAQDRPVQPVARSRSTDRELYQPVTATNVLYDLKDEGTVYVNGDTPARRLRYRYLDTYTWKNPRTNASLKWSVPRDEIRVLPASLN